MMRTCVCGEVFELIRGTKNYCSYRCAFDAKWQENSLNGCWEWTGTRNNKGYGSFSNGLKDVKAHRHSFELHVSPIPEGLFVCHHCDNPSCVNPSHLFLGTVLDNRRDAVEKSRIDKYPRYKLNEQAIKVIRWLDKPTVLLALHYKVSRQTINKILTRKIWRHVA